MLSSHVLEEVERVCDHVVALSEGRLVAQGSMAELAGASGGIELELVEIADRPRSVDDVAAAPGGRRCRACDAPARRCRSPVCPTTTCSISLLAAWPRPAPACGASVGIVERSTTSSPTTLQISRCTAPATTPAEARGDRLGTRRRADRRTRLPTLRRPTIRCARCHPQRELGEHSGHARPRSTGAQQDLPGDRRRDCVPAGRGVHRHRRADPRRHPGARRSGRLPGLLRVHLPRHRALHGARRARGARLRSTQRDAGDVPVDAARPTHLSDGQGRCHCGDARPRHVAPTGAAADRLHGGERWPRWRCGLACHARSHRAVGCGDLGGARCGVDGGVEPHRSPCLRRGRHRDAADRHPHPGGGADRGR